MKFFTLTLIWNWACADPKQHDSPAAASPDSSPIETQSDSLLVADSEDSSSEDATLVWTGMSMDEGLGWSLAEWDGELYAGAPWGESGRVYRLAEAGALELVWEGDRAAGLSLAAVGSELYLGSPLGGAGGEVYGLSGGLHAQGPELSRGFGMPESGEKL